MRHCAAKIKPGKDNPLKLMEENHGFNSKL